MVICINMSIQTSDREIRQAFHTKNLARYKKSNDTLIIDELGVDHGRTRVDIAVINGLLHGYEIKSSKDNLNRLENQLKSFTKCFQKITIVTAENHLDSVLQISPSYVGVICTQKGSRGGISFSTIRKTQRNPEVDTIAMAHLLWRPEALRLLTSLGVDKSLLRGTKETLYKNISKLVTVEELSSYIKEQFFLRKYWRMEN